MCQRCGCNLFFLNQNDFIWEFIEWIKYNIFWHFPSNVPMQLTIFKVKISIFNTIQASFLKVAKLKIFSCNICIFKNQNLIKKTTANNNQMFHCFFFFFLSFFLIVIHSKGWTATMRHRVPRKRSTKRLKHAESLFRQNLQMA